MSCCRHLPTSFCSCLFSFYCLLGAYPATGSFSRTAIKSKAGVRTPLAGLITAIVVLLAIYALPPRTFRSFIQTNSFGIVVLTDLLAIPGYLILFYYSLLLYPERESGSSHHSCCG